MSELVLHFGNPIQVQDDEFVHGFQIGYLHFKTDFANLIITDDLVYTVITQNIIDVRRFDRHNAGYITGWIAALLEKQPEQRQPEQDRHVARILPFQPRPAAWGEVQA